MVKKFIKSLLGRRSDTAESQHYSIGKCRVDIGRFTYGAKGIKVVDWGEGAHLKIGSFCSIAGGVRILMGGNHRADWITTFPFGAVHKDALPIKVASGTTYSNGDVVIGNDVWIGTDVTILSGVTIGDGAVVAATSTIVKDIGPYEIWGGNPAKLIKKRFDDDTIAALMALKWWDLPLDQITAMAPDLSAIPTANGLAKLKETL